ncbi:MAG: hypothetical protein CVV44_10160 [Spirochaetae bacterium HGW-Spirochaetae-1]|jgi:hypothetical protein|nr:MAG: hypothetical protein CVV44_10160 [Spirochaetae bacterium HGW-Spirochaetae-1]
MIFLYRSSRAKQRALASSNITPDYLLYKDAPKTHYKDMESEYLDNEGNIIDYYSVFEIPYNAEPHAIRNAFRTLIKQHHPDISHDYSNDNTDLIDLIIRAYRVLADTETRKDYDRYLFKNVQLRYSTTLVIPRRRVKYSASLNELLKANLKPRGIKRKDILLNFGQDIEILVTPEEGRRGAVAYIELPSRMTCPLCSGRNPQCHVCRGMGRIHTTSHLEVSIPPHTESGTVIDVDLLKIRPDRFTSFRARGIRIRISRLPDNSAV